MDTQSQDKSTQTICEKSKEKFTCTVCQGKHTLYNKNKHEKTGKHLKALAAQSPQTPSETESKCK
jgi:surfactin synthase thioesterase subunit